MKLMLTIVDPFGLNSDRRFYIIQKITFFFLFGLPLSHRTLESLYDFFYLKYTLIGLWETVFKIIITKKIIFEFNLHESR